MIDFEFNNDWYKYNSFGELMKNLGLIKDFEWKDEWYSYDSFEDLMRGLRLL